MKLEYFCGSKLISLEVNADVDAGSDEWKVCLPNGATYNVELKSEEIVEGTVSFDRYIGDRGESIRKRCTLPLALTERGIEISYLGSSFVFTEPETGRRAKHRRPADTGMLIAPMVGVLSDLFVGEGDTVAAWQPLAVVEAMKVMATIEAPFAGTVRRVYAAKGDQLGHGQPIIDLAPAENEMGLIPDP